MIPVQHWLIFLDSTIFGETPTSKAISGIFPNKLDLFFTLKNSQSMPQFFTVSQNNGFLFIFLEDLLGLKFKCLLACVLLTIALRMSFPNSLGQFRSQSLYAMILKIVCKHLGAHIALVNKHGKLGGPWNQGGH